MTFKVKEGIRVNGQGFVNDTLDVTANTLELTGTTQATSTTTGALQVAGGIGVEGNLYVGGIFNVGGGFSVNSLTGDLTVDGNLTVNGTTTTLNSTELTVDDINIILGASASPTDASANLGGITLKGTTDKTLVWVQGTASWTSSENLDLAGTKVYSIATNEVLSADTLFAGQSTVSLAPTGSSITVGVDNSGTLTLRNALVDVDYDLSVGGSTSLTGNLTINTNKFSVIASSGNTSIGGALDVTGNVTGSVLISDVADGTAPLNVTSTTVVSNLNADLLDGFQANEGNSTDTVVVRGSTGGINFTTAILHGSTSGSTTLQPQAAASGTLTLPSATDTLVGRATTDTLTNKTLDLTNNSLSGTLAEFNTALSDGSFASLAGTETLTNKTLTDPTINAGSGTLVLPNGTAPAQTAEGSVFWDSDDNLLTVGTGTGRKIMVDLDSTQTLTNKTLATPSFTGISQDYALTGDVTGSVTVNNLGNVSITTTIAANSVALGTDTTGNYIATISGTTDQVTVTGSGSESASVTLSLPQNIATTSSPTFAGATLDNIQVGVTAANEIDTSAGNLIIDSAGGTTTVDDDLVVSGNLTVNGTTTTINTTALEIEDVNITLAKNATQASEANGAGFTVGGVNETFSYNAGTGDFDLSTSFNVANGETFKVNGSTVLSSTSLGSGVTGSSLTSVGTIGTGTWQGTVISPTYGGTGVNNGTKTITLGGNFTHTGAHTLGLTTTGNTSVTLPTTGTLATTGNLSQFASTSSSQLAGIISDETGSGALVFANSPQLTTPTVAVINGSTLANGTLTLRGTSNVDKNTASVLIDENVGSTSATTGSLVVTGGVGISQNLNVAGTIKLDSTGVADVLDLNNNNIVNVNNIKIADPGPNEGIEWAGGNVWKIYESPDDLTTNGAGNLQLVQGSTRRATFKTNGRLEIPVATGQPPLEVASTTLVDNFNADLLDGQEGTYYLDWTNVTNKPDPVVTVTLTGDVTGSANTTLTDLGNGTVSVATTIEANSVALGTDTTGNYVATVAGTTNQVTVTGSGSESAAVTISLPQDIHTGAEPTFAGATLDNIRVGVTDGNEIDTTSGNLTLDSAGGTTTIDDNLIVSGDLTVNGTTTTVNSTTVTIDDPIFTLGGETVPTSDDAKDRGIEFRWHDGANAKLGFFGYDRSTGKFTFIPDASNASEVFSGTKGTLDANIEWSDILNKPDPTLTIDGDASGSATFTDVGNATLTLTVSDDSHNHGVGTITNFTEEVQDVVGGMVSTNTESGISVTYDDTAGKLNFDVNDPTITLTGAVTGSATMTDLGNVSISTSIGADTVALGTNTTGNYVANVQTGTGLTGGSTGSEGASLTLSLNHLGIENLVDPDGDRILFWDDSAGATDWLSIGSGLSLVGSTITASDRGSSQNIFKTIAVTDTDTGNVWSSTGSIVADSNNDTVTFVDGAGVDIFASPTTDAIRIEHSDTSSVSNLSANSRTYVSALTFDGFGHVTGYSTATETVVDTNNYVNGATFASATGVLSLSRQGLTDVTVNLDGRYLTSESDTLATVTARGATTSSAISITNTTASTTNDTGALTVDGGVGINGAVNIGGNTDIDGNLVVGGNLTVSGTTTTVNTETISLADNIITLNSNATGTPTENGGIEVERGDSTNVAVRWNEGNDRWEFTNNGTTYYNIPLSTEYDNYGSWTVLEGNGSETSTVGSGETMHFEQGTGMQVELTATRQLTFTNTDRGSSQNIFKNIAVSGQTDIVADSNNDTLTFANGTGISVTTNATTDTVTITNSDTGSAQNIFKNITVENSDGSDIGTVTADSNNDTLFIRENGAIELGFNATSDIITIAHADTSSVSNLSSNNSGSTFIQDISFEFDAYGHVTAASVATANALTSQANDFGTISVLDADDAGYTWATTGNIVADAVSDQVTLVPGGGILLNADTGNDAVRISHADTSSVSNLSSDNSAGTVIQDISFTYDTYGHVTASSVATVNLDNRYLQSESDTLASVTGRGATTASAISITNTTASTTNDTGALTVDGGVGINGAVNIGGNTDIDGNLVIGGNLTVSGTTTTVNTETINLADNIILLNSNETGTPSQDGGIEIERGTQTNAALFWDESAGKWTVDSPTHSGVLALTSEIPTVNNATITITAGDGLGTGGDFTTNQSSNETITLTNTDKGSSQNIFKNFTVEQSNGTDRGTVVADSNNDTVFFRENGGITMGVDATNDIITIAHADTSSQASVDNSNATVVQDITLDTYGHITGINSVDLDSRFVNVTGDTMSGNLTINGALNATTKSFVIDHPTKANMKLRYVSLEGPEAGVYVRGRITGSTVIELPDYWTGLVDASTITVNLTPIGSFQAVYVEGTSAESVTIAIDNKPNSDIDCYYTIFAERKDVEKLVVEYEDK